MWISMVEQYIKAINNGTVPAIESSWTYICQTRALELMDKLKKNFEEGLTNELQLPCNETELDACIDFYSDKFKQDMRSDYIGEPESLQ